MIISYLIIAITAIVSILAFSNHNISDKLKFNAYRINHNKEWYRMFTYGFVHANWFHLFVNMFVLYSFGKYVEYFFKMYFMEYGVIIFVLFYMLSLLASTTYSYEKHKQDIFYNAVGASGAVSAIVFASILFFPIGKMIIFPIPIPLPSFVFGILYLIYSLYMSKKGNDNVGHDAHLFGAIFGFLFPIAIKPKLFMIFIEQLQSLF